MSLRGGAPAPHSCKDMQFRPFSEKSESGFSCFCTSFKEDKMENRNAELYELIEKKKFIGIEKNLDDILYLN